MQLNLFQANPPIEKEEPLLMIGGIYTDKREECVDPDAPYAISFGKAFHFLFNGMDHINNIVEIGGAHNMKLVKGYALAVLRNKKIIQIRNSGIKHSPEYIIWQASYEEGFYESLKPYKKIFHK